MNRPSQKMRVLAALRAAGTRGLTQVDFLPPVIDGGPPAGRLASRIDELRTAGHCIQTVRQKNGTAQYVLHELAPQPTPDLAAAERLVDVDHPAPASPYEEDCSWPTKS